MDIAHLGFEVETADLKRTDELLDKLGRKSDEVEAKFGRVGESFGDILKRNNAANDNSFQQFAKQSETAADAVKRIGTESETATKAVVKNNDTAIQSFNKARLAVAGAAAAIGAAFVGFTNIADDYRALNDRLRTVTCLLYTSPSPRDRQKSRMPSSA